MLTAEKKTFMQLIMKETIRIPNYQREYAQGRDDAAHGRRAVLIRTNLVGALYKSLTDNTGGEKLELDFIFGGRPEEDVFNPVDGQQRLTILFLLHWYIFKRANNNKGLKILKGKFKYSTRYTSETFCEKLCDESGLRFDVSASIADQIKDKAWYTGSMDCDPTVKSMLVVINCIHERFKDYQDFDALSEMLNGENCPVYFSCMNMQDALGGDSGIRDLYIKMNARGVPLTDFELFKADLQKKTQRNNDRYDLMAAYLGDEDTAAARVGIIGKFNNEYTNFFFKLIDNGTTCVSQGNGSKKQLFDTAMMNFINEIFRMNFFCAISNCVSQRTYTNGNDPFKKMSGKEFTAFLETHGESIYRYYFYDEKAKEFNLIPDKVPENVKDALIKSFRDINELLDFFSDTGVSSTYLDVSEASDTKCIFSLGKLIKGLAVAADEDKAIPYSDSLVRMALYDFILLAREKNCLSEEAFNYWNRFVWKVYKNANPDYKNFYEAIETLKGYRQLLKKCDRLDIESINKAIASIKIDTDDLKLDGLKAFTPPAHLQLEEEQIKCALVCNDWIWQDVIINAENYFSDNGQLWFLLELAKDESNYYRRERFEKAFEISKKLLDGNKRLTIDSSLFERALLALTLTTKDFEGKDHLWHMSKNTTSTKRFVGDDFSKHLSHRFCSGSDPTECDRYEITVKLLENMLNDEQLNADGIEDWLKGRINDCIENWSPDTAIDKQWKYMFVKYDLRGEQNFGLDFKNGFEPKRWYDAEENPYTAVYTNEQRRTDSGELNSFALAYILNKRFPNSVQYKTSNSEEYIDNSFPNRYFTFNDNAIGFMNGQFWERTTTATNPIGNFENALANLTVQP